MNYTKESIKAFNWSLYTTICPGGGYFSRIMNRNNGYLIGEMWGPDRETAEARVLAYMSKTASVK